MNDIQLSPHFKLSEFCDNWRGGEMERRNWEIGASEPYLTKMKLLCSSILEPLRRKFQEPVIISSGLRWAEYKGSQWSGLDYEIRSVRAKKTYDGRSQHTRGEAADIHVLNVSERTVFNWIKDECPNPYGQVIYEVAGRSCWIHASIPGFTIESRGGNLIYGEAKDAYQDSLGRWSYKSVGRTDRWQLKDQYTK